VALNNEEAISVNANDPRIAARCIRVNKRHCKLGKARDLSARRRNYEKVFGPHTRRLAIVSESVNAKRLSDLSGCDDHKRRDYWR
jgi:hypothetical protein